MVNDWKLMTIDELFTLREQMHEVLSAKLKAKKVELERRLHQLNQPWSDVKIKKSRWPWPAGTHSTFEDYCWRSETSAALGGFGRLYCLSELLNFGQLVAEIDWSLQKTLFGKLARPFHLKYSLRKKNRFLTMVLDEQ
jgi:hypothetical protein